MGTLVSVVVFLCCALTSTTTGQNTPGTKGCISTVERSFRVIRKEHCLVSKNDVKLSCPSDKIVVLIAIMAATKSSSSGCMKRVLSQNEDFCCNVEEDDVFYEGLCLQDLWNKEDRIHYNQFATSALRRCTKTSQCVLKANMFANLQTEIPISNHHSSYFQLLYRCVSAPSNFVTYCSSTSLKGKELHFQSRFMESNIDRICTCRVTSKGGGDVIVRAVDVTTTNTDLLLSSGHRRRNVSHSPGPEFGYRELFSGKTVDISVKTGTKGERDSLWLQISGSDGKDVYATCGDRKIRKESTSVMPRRVSSVTVENEFMGYWPLIYVASGSIFTIVIVLIILAGLLICRYRKKKERGSDQCPHPSCQYPPEPRHDQYGHHYASVMGETLTLPRTRGVKPMSIHTLARTRDKQYVTSYPVSTSTRSIRPTSVPPPVPPNTTGSEHTIAPSSEVSELEAFLEYKG